MTDDSDYLDAIARYLSDTETLWNMVDGEIYVDFPEEEVLEHLGGTYQTLIGISIISDNSLGRMGAYTHKIQETSVVIQIDVASLRGNNAKYCRQVCTKIKDLCFYDIDKTLNGTNYHIFVTSIDTQVYYDEKMGCWHGVVSINGNYQRTAS